MKRVIPVFFAVLLSITFSFSQTPVTEAIDFTATDVEGHEWNLFNLLDSGQWVCIDFFFTTCGPCQETAPKVNEAFNYFGCNSSNVTFLAIDNGDTDAECIVFDETYGVEYPTISGVEGGGTQICNNYQIVAYPTVILIAPDHQVVEQDIWPISTAQTLISVLESHGLEEAECQYVGVEEGLASGDIGSVITYPNPFYESFMLDFTVSGNVNISIEIFDMMGSCVASIPQACYLAGRNEIAVSLSGKAPGLYYVRLGNTIGEIAHTVVHKF